MVRLIMLILLVLGSSFGFSCTTFVLKDSKNLVFGRNLDWVSDNGLVVVNKRGVNKTSLVFPPEKPVTWTSKLGSVSFNQFGKEFPYGGMNEKGLVVELMKVAGSYPNADNRGAVNELQWVQYQLDNSTTIEDVISSDKKIRISKVDQNLHFLICDKQGNTAVIEFTKKGMVVFKGDDLPIPVLENDIYSKSLQKNKQGVSCRFNTAANMIDKFKAESGSSIDYSFRILDQVALQGSWSIVYDIKNLKIHFKTESRTAVRSVGLGQFNFACSESSLLYDLMKDERASINDQFVAYQTKLNKKKFDAAVKSNRIALPNQVLAIFSNYSESCKCVR